MVHEFKGKERDSVYIWKDTFGYFPASKADAFIPAEIEEERRVHYIACTRARQKCTIYALKICTVCF
jgi:DNA helicase-2/ATP-dependent DNA helicase PcrA